MRHYSGLALNEAKHNSDNVIKKQLLIMLWQELIRISPRNEIEVQTIFQRTNPSLYSRIYKHPQRHFMLWRGFPSFLQWVGGAKSYRSVILMICHYLLSPFIISHFDAKRFFFNSLGGKTLTNASSRKQIHYSKIWHFLLKSVNF